MRSSTWTEMVGTGRRPPTILDDHVTAVVVDFPKPYEDHEEEEDESPCPPPDGQPIPAEALEAQTVEEAELFVQPVDERSGKHEYTAGRTLMGRNAAHTIFMMPSGPKGLPWMYLQIWDGSDDDKLVTLYWPGARVEVRGENLAPLYPLVAMQRISIWRAYDAKEHGPPKPGDPIIHSIKFVPVTAK